MLSSIQSIQLFYFLRIKVQIYYFSSYCDMPHLAAESRGDFFYRSLERSGEPIMYGILKVACWKVTFMFERI